MKHLRTRLVMAVRLFYEDSRKFLSETHTNAA